LDERRFGCRDDAEGIADRAPVPRHPEEKIRGAWLIALEDRLGQQIEVLIFPNCISIQQHYRDPLLRRASTLVVAERTPAADQP
jgi:hypothetical protein